MKTFSAKPHEVERKWYVIDAKGKVLGQVAVEAARLLRGKHNPFSPITLTPATLSWSSTRIRSS
jgi:ribosomal protein L13